MAYPSVQLTNTTQDVPEGSNEIWREQATYPIPEFFEDLKQKFIDLVLVSDTFPMMFHCAVLTTPVTNGRGRVGGCGRQ